jgi:decaprenylphospho-beta-D-ribofuranose 2-oxidase
MSRLPTAPTQLTGWGRTAPTAAGVTRAVDPSTVDRAMADAVGSVRSSGRGIIARGLGRSYGDAAQNAGGSVVDTTWLDSFHRVDLDSGVVTVAAGVSLQSLMERLVPQGWFVPVTPGTRLVTVGGAIAADIHGKNHHVDGSFCSHVLELTLVTPTGTETVSAASDPELFWATAGGMGLTGIITAATLQMIPIETSYLLVDAERAADLDTAMDKLLSGDDAYRYSVAWIDCQSTGSRLGRSVLTRGNHARLEELPERLRRRPDRARAFSPRTLARVPITPPRGLLNPLTVGAFNEFWFRKAPAHQVARPHHMSGFFHPLDGVGAWNRLYGRRGFLQYQFVVPDDHGDTVRKVIERLTTLRLASFLAVLKRFGPGDPGPLSFPMPGWTLALDLPVGHHELDTLLDSLDTEVIAAGGRVYLAKDSRVSPAAFRSMYPRVDEWLAVKERVDPDGVLRSDLGRRLGLCTDRVPAGPARAESARAKAGSASPSPAKAKSARSVPAKAKSGKTAPAKVRTSAAKRPPAPSTASTRSTPTSSIDQPDGAPDPPSPERTPS